MPLSFAPVGQILRLVGIRGGLCVHNRLIALGLTPGVELKIVCKNPGGPVILAVKDSRLAIGRGLLHHIEVEPVGRGSSTSQENEDLQHTHHRRGHRRFHGRRW